MADKRRPVILKSIDEIKHSAEHLWGTILGNAGQNSIVSIINTEHTLLYFNHLAEELFKRQYPEGYSFVGKKCYEAFRNRDSPCPECQTAEVIKTQRPARSFTHHNPLVEKMFEVSAYPVNEKIDDAVQTVAIIEVSRDISWDFLVGGLLHNANNALTGLFGSLDMAKQELFSGSSEEGRYNLDIAVTSARRAGDLVNDAFRILSQHDRRDHQTRQDMDLRRAINDAVQMFADRYKRAKIKLSLDLKNIPMINASMKGLQSVFENLLMNAYEALQESNTVNPEVVVRTYHQPLSKGGYIHAEVQDNGPGIKEDIINRIFDPHFSTKSRRGLHYGLGTAKLVIEQNHCGKLYVQSKYGHGAKFGIILPDATRMLELHGIKKEKPTS